MESISPVILRVREARAPAAGFSAPEPFGGFVRCASLRSLPHAGRAKNRAPHPPRRDRPGDSGEPLSNLAAAFAHAPGARPAEVSRPAREPSAHKLGRRFAAAQGCKGKPRQAQNPAGFIDGRSVGCWPAFAPLCDNRRVPQRRLTCWAGPSTRGEVMPYDRTSYRSAQSSGRNH